MTRFAAVRILRTLLTLIVSVSITFVVLRASGDAALQILGPNARAPDIAAFRREWGLDQPIWVQYVLYLRNLLHGDLGKSMLDGQDALAIVLARVAVTLQLTLPALAVNILLGIPAGICSALYRDTVVDRSLMIASVIGFTVPSFVLALILILVFSVWLGVLPSGGADSLASGVLPIATLGIGGAAVLARYTKSAMVAVLGRLYITAASAKGIRWKNVVRNHAFPNAAIPIVTLFGLMLGSQIAGSVLIEAVFGWPGIGQLLVTSVANRDLAVVQVILLLVTATMTVSNLLVDVLYGFIDPRMRHA
ncbi:ABC transporter permease [Rhizobium jaguaris]|uniref:ABC transporter permease n=1 Tax=Rhizobium jaguaris TaxID=1312183 RepID=A0A387G2B8_9HYPH|nr:ABC transporter permease [Rhizobium jaguaris]AYG63947.1 ABC transporter permease [Rhizobium jaguaris]